MSKLWSKQQFTTFLALSTRIIQWGMAHIGTAELISAVSSAGAPGTIGCCFYQPMVPRLNSF
jgi:NAD(P)H-dependent flavin oxidoreductase YrpB (nitropropane dioxygenase family)